MKKQKIGEDIVSSKGGSFEKLKAEFEADIKRRKDHPFLSIPWEVVDFIKYTVPSYFDDTKYEIKLAWQRVYRGFDDSAVWNHHSYHSEQTAKILRMLAEEKVGCPGEMYSESKNGKDSCAKWTKTLIKMAEGFEAATAIDNMEFFIEDEDGEYNQKESDKKYKALEKKFHEGMELYHKWYFHLWD